MRIAEWPMAERPRERLLAAVHGRVLGSEGAVNAANAERGGAFLDVTRVL